MKVSREDIEARFQNLSDDALARIYLSGDLSDLGQEIAKAELNGRGISVRKEPSESKVEKTEQILAGRSGNLVRVAGHLTYAEAQLLCTSLESEGIPAVLADVHMATANMFLSLATGGVRVLVHENNLDRANEVVAAVKRGDYEIDDDFDVDEQQ